MTIVPGKVVNGRIEVEDTELPEGADVAVYYKPDVEEYELTEEQEAELEASIAEADRGAHDDGLSARAVEGAIAA